MKLMFISDIHGSSLYAQKAIDTYKQEKADKLIILGDILYHAKSPAAVNLLKCLIHMSNCALDFLR